MTFTNLAFLVIDCFLLPSLSFLNHEFSQLFKDGFFGTSVLCRQSPSLLRAKLEHPFSQILRQTVHQAIDAIESGESSFRNEGFGDRRILEDIDVQVESGRVFNEFIE